MDQHEADLAAQVVDRLRASWERLTPEGRITATAALSRMRQAIGPILARIEHDDADRQAHARFMLARLKRRLNALLDHEEDKHGQQGP